MGLAPGCNSSRNAKFSAMYSRHIREQHPLLSLRCLTRRYRDASGPARDAYQDGAFLPVEDYTTGIIGRQRRKFFGIVWGTSLSHDDLNSPAAADDLYARFLADLEAKGVLNTTALIFMSNHGLRFGDVLITRQGRLEERLPLLYFSLPDWARERYPAAARNLQLNRDRLVTVYDLHATMHDLMDLSSLASPRRAPRPPQPCPRGLSLFTAIPPERTCETAVIPKHYCACQEYDEEPADDHRPAGPPQPARRCAVVDVRGGPLRLRTRTGGGAALQYEYEIVVRTHPGGALLSATVVYRMGTATMHLDGTVSRINSYGTAGARRTYSDSTAFASSSQPASSPRLEDQTHSMHKFQYFECSHCHQLLILRNP
ncbi:Acetylglutamate kinase [Frankliniella fusca]|uniref:Acetylglutamate kinase n=1 Tax=Frankliniella fusca TaxID=407009 RepID=A0AAE1H0Q6_9NEOP|nr:Acetylglutamate kinase [Frankliniella fusca]